MKILKHLCSILLTLQKYVYVSEQLRSVLISRWNLHFQYNECIKMQARSCSKTSKYK